MDDDRHLAARDPWRLLTAEHFLQPHRQHRRLTLFVIQPHMGTTWDGDVCGHEAIQFLPLLPRQQALERLSEIEAANLREACQAIEEGSQPACEVFLQRLV